MASQQQPQRQDLKEGTIMISLKPPRMSFMQSIRFFPI